MAVVVALVVGVDEREGVVVPVVVVVSLVVCDEVIEVEVVGDVVAVEVGVVSLQSEKVPSYKYEANAAFNRSAPLLQAADRR
jgi:hypothetical protein